MIRRSLPEGGIRVPFNVWWPGVVPAAQVEGALVEGALVEGAPVEGARVHLQDLFAAAGIPAGAVVRAGLDSRDPLPTLKGVGAPTAPPPLPRVPREGVGGGGALRAMEGDPLPEADGKRSTP